MVNRNIVVVRYLQIMLFTLCVERLVGLWDTGAQ